MSTITIVAAISETHLIIRKEDGGLYARTPFGPDQPMPAENDPEMTRAALVGKWGAYRVLGEDGGDQPRADANDIAIVEPRTMEDGETVYQIAERIPPDWDNPQPWQQK